MNFIEPAFLLGILAAAGPLIVHLINRKKAARQEFPAMRFLLASHKRVARGAKIKKWLLLALRMLVVGVLATALAKPFVSSQDGTSAVDRLPTATVVVLDTSLSMGAQDWWEDALSAANREIGDLRPWDEVAMVFADAGLQTPIDRLTTDHTLARNALDDLQPGFQTTDLPGALRVAADLLAPTKLPNKRIVLITDMRRGGFPDNAAGAVALDVPVEVVRVANEDASSLAVVDVAYEQEGTRREPTFRVDATIENFGATDARGVEVRFVLDGVTVGASKVDVGAGKRVLQTFRHRVDGMQARQAAVSLVDADTLEADNHRHFVLRGNDRIRVLLVNGEPASVVYRDELFFFERALNPKGSSDTFVTTTVTREGLEGLELSQFDVVVLANVTTVSAGAATDLQAFVEGGGGLLMTMGDQVEVDAWNAQLGGLLPKPLRGLKQLAEVGDPDAPVKVTHYGTTLRTHPIFEVFEAPGGNTLQTSVVYSYMLLEPSPPEQAQTLMTLKDSAPALLERKVGRGRVLLLTTTVDADWTDLPTRTSYLPLSRRMIQHLARRATSTEQPAYLVGEPVTLDVEGLYKDRMVLTLADRRVVLEPKDGKLTWTPDHPGVWQVWADAAGDQGAHIGALDFAVNPSTAESDLRTLPEDALSPWLGGQAGATASRTTEKRVNIWPILLFLVTIGLLLESVISTRRSVQARLWRMATRQRDPELTEDAKPTA